MILSGSRATCVLSQDFESKVPSSLIPKEVVVSVFPMNSDALPAFFYYYNSRNLCLGPNTDIYMDTGSLCLEVAR